MPAVDKHPQRRKGVFPARRLVNGDWPAGGHRRDPVGLSSTDRWLVLPELFETACRQFGVTDRVLDVLVTQIQLDGARVLAGVRQVKARRVTQHVGVDGELYPSGLGGCRDDVVDRAPRHRATAERGEHVRCCVVALFAPPRPQGP